MEERFVLPVVVLARLSVVAERLSGVISGLFVVRMASISEMKPVKYIKTFACTGDAEMGRDSRT